ncbi:HAMP domain-containing histidine kinase [Kitasatospora sp. RG8]|uniref:sensor histidine kinase n=1 Tax=Kitasatospora sp. RG8 TaxID=2820815 RepID=UPI001ADEE5E6|nr:HAMP domain-containing sensor histidine kinase [Kitasatospora sp. RG8]MBP0451084.1 HAMP domain-containing histidine kinase [Kitasatospora sp. RG8]
MRTDPLAQPFGGYRSWCSWRPGVRLRSALAALLASAVAFGIATVWAGRTVQEELEYAATARAGLMVQNFAHKIPDGPDEPFQDVSYAVMAEDGHWLRSSLLSAQLQREAPRLGLLPIDPGARRSRIEGEPTSPRCCESVDEVAVRLPSDVLPSLGTWRLRGRTVRFYRTLAGPFTSDQLAKYSGITNLPPQWLTVYVLIDTQEAEQAAATVTHLLGSLLAPGASLFVALTAWLVTGFALRPVESVRRGMARIGAGAFHERVPVPPSRDTVARLAITTNTTLDRLERALAEQRRLVADASHELRSPLAALRSTLEVPLAHPAQADWPAVVAGALTDTERLQGLADDLLLLARTQEAGADGRAEGTVELYGLITEQLAERGHTDPGLTFRFEPLEGLGEQAEVLVPGREVLVGRILRNLLDNAARHADETVTVRLGATGGWARLEVDDDGLGIPVGDRERVFDRFVRLDTARNRATGGAGLGLALVRTIATSLGGTATAGPPPCGFGGHLVVRLPLADG